MGLTPNVIWIIVAVFGGSFLLMIPIAISQQKRKKKSQNYVEQNQDKAILHIYAHSPVIDGEKIKKLEYQRGTDLEYIIALSPGTHTIEAIYQASEPSLGKNVNYKTPVIKSDIEFEAGGEYTLAMYFYSPEQRKSYYKGDVGEDVYSEELDNKNRYLGASANAYIICYKES